MKKIVVSYIPALHQGYLNFIKTYADQVYVLGNDFLKSVPRLERDIRAIAPTQMSKAIAALGIADQVRVLNLSNIREITAARSVLPDEEVNRAFARKYLNQANYKLVPAFLRWDKFATTAKHVVSPTHKISKSKADKLLMKRAFQEADKSPDWWRQVGALAVIQGKPVLSAHNTPSPSEDYTVNIFGDPRSNFDAGQSIELSKVIHAEAGLIASAARLGIPLEGASLYASTFPCPVCAKLVAAAGFKKVYYSEGYSLLDAEDILKAKAIDILQVV